MFTNRPPLLQGGEEEGVLAPACDDRRVQRPHGGRRLARQHAGCLQSQNKEKKMVVVYMDVGPGRHDGELVEALQRCVGQEGWGQDPVSLLHAAGGGADVKNPWGV